MIFGEETPGECRGCGAQLLPDSNFCHKCGTVVVQKKVSDSAYDTVEIISGAGDTELPKLYHVHSTVNNFRYQGILYDNLKINWFVVGRDKPPVPFDRAIINYAELNPEVRINPESYIMERFTLIEADLLKGYLASAQKIDAVVDELTLPVSDTLKGYRSGLTAPGTDFIPLFKKQNYNLSFKVEGIFNIKMADERIVPDERATVITRVSPEILKKIADEKDTDD
jgi:hypothetical protein